MERTVLVTGASSAVGRATAEAFCDEEWTVYAAVREEGVTLPDRGGLRQETLDVTDPRDVARVIERITDETDRIDALVTLPGRAVLGPLEDTPTATVTAAFDHTLFGYHRLLREVLPEMRDRENGTVVTVTSAAASTAFPGGGVHAGTQTALAAATDALRRETSALDVVRVEAGPVADGGAPHATDPDDRTDAYESVYGLVDDWGKLGPDNPLSVAPEAVADVIVNAASATQPATRYPVGPVAQLAGLARLLPGWLTDAGWRLARRLG
ncbi:MAG: SDR family NAD(P)-dependent oxidoreductase [Halobaculum sp.]